MVPTNDFVPFCPTDTGTNLLSESDYIAAADRTSGNKPGVASSKLNNKALRQSTYIAQVVAQLIANKTGTDVLDDATPAKILAQASAAFTQLPRVFTTYTTVGAATHKCTLYFFTAAANATAGATYTNNGNTYTVVTTIAGATMLQVTGIASPTASGTLTKASGTGDATITFYAVRVPTRIIVSMVGGGAGGGGGGTSGSGAGGDGTGSVFGTSTAAGGLHWTSGANSTTTANTAGAGHTILSNITGGQGNQGGAWAGTSYANFPGPAGGCSFYGGNGGGLGGSAATNSGSGGGGGSAGNLVNASAGGAGGGSGGFMKLLIDNPALTYSLTVGNKGAGGAAGASGGAGGAGGEGRVEVEEVF
jgi:hypothetical protein